MIQYVCIIELLHSPRQEMTCLHIRSLVQTILPSQPAELAEADFLLYLTLSKFQKCTFLYNVAGLSDILNHRTNLHKCYKED